MRTIVDAERFTYVQTLSKRRDGRVFEAAQLQRLRVDDGPVAGHLVNQDRVVRGDFVQVPAGQDATLGHLRVVVAGALDPGAGRRGERLVQHLAGQLGQRPDDAGGDVEVEEVFGDDRGVDVGVDEAGHDHGLAEVRERGVREAGAEVGG